MHSFWIRKLATITALSFCLSGIVNALEEQNSGAVSQKRIEKRGFSILPPKGDKWVVTEENKNRITFMKSRSRTHSLGMDVIRRQLPDKERNLNFESPEAFLQYMKTMHERERSPHLRILRTDLVLDGRFAEYCFRYYYGGEYPGDPHVLPGKFLISETFGYQCLDPESQGMYIDISVFQIGLPVEVDPTFRAIAESFFDGFRLRH